MNGTNTTILRTDPFTDPFTPVSITTLAASLSPTAIRKSTNGSMALLVHRCNTSPGPASVTAPVTTPTSTGSNRTPANHLELASSHSNSFLRFFVVRKSLLATLKSTQQPQKPVNDRPPKN